MMKSFASLLVLLLLLVDVPLVVSSKKASKKKGCSSDSSSSEDNGSAAVAQPRGFVGTSAGPLGYRSTGSLASCKTAVICFHLAPRSSDDYTEMMPYLSGDDNRLVIAVDMPGFGISPPQERELSLDDLGDMAVEVADSFGIEEFAVVGSSLGAYVCLNAAARYPDRIVAVVLSNPYRFRDELVALAEMGVTFDFDFFPDFVFNQTGSHFLQLWDIRKDFVSPLLNTRLTQDHMTYQINGLQAKTQNGVTKLLPDLAPFVDWETLAPAVQAPVLTLFGEVALQIFDFFELDATGQMPGTVALFGNVESQIIAGGSLWQFNEKPEELGAAIVSHIDAASDGCNL